MGICGSIRDKDDNLLNNISFYINKEEKNSSFKIETLLPNIADYIKFSNLKIIEKQKEKSICKIIKDDTIKGTGFLSLIPFPDKVNQLPVLITCNHVIKGDEKEVKLIFNDKIEKILILDKTRKTYINYEKDIIIIEIKKKR